MFLSHGVCEETCKMANPKKPQWVIFLGYGLIHFWKNDLFFFHRLDEISDEEDLDLIPPRPVDDRCQCCGAVTLQGCVIS